MSIFAKKSLYWHFLVKIFKNKALFQKKKKKKKERKPLLDFYLNMIFKQFQVFF